MSFLRYHRNSDLKLLNPKNDLLYEINTHFTKQLLQKFLSSFHRKTFPFPPQASGCHLISFPNFLKDIVSKLGDLVSAFTL